MKILQMSLALVSLSIAGSGFSVTTKKAFPEVKIEAYQVGELNKDNVKNKVTVVNLWATWCEACKVELKEMETVFAPLFMKDKFQFAMVSLDKNPEKAREWIEANLKNPETALKHLYKDPQFKFAEIFANDTFPVTLIVDGEGNVVEVHEGYDEKSGQTEKIANRVRELLEKI